MIAARRWGYVLSIGILSSLAGCGDGGIQGVKQWMEETKRQSRVSVPKLAEPKRFTPFIYNAKDSIDPYSMAKLAVALAKAQGNTASKFKPDLDRRREPLENFPLDNLKMVGTLQKTNLNFALLQVEGTVYQVKVGNYVGQNFGMITKISENEVELKEIVQDASGDWVERKAKLELQEAKK